jgi:hypothetical protein
MTAEIKVLRDFATMTKTLGGLFDAIATAIECGDSAEMARLSGEAVKFMVLLESWNARMQGSVTTTMEQAWRELGRQSGWSATDYIPDDQLAKLVADQAEYDAAKE